MGDWNFLGGVLEEVHIHSTMVGKIWLTVLFIFRMLVLGVAAEDIWTDEQAAFVCNTDQPGCRNVCYDRAFPISPIRYWVLQVVFVSSPSLVYMGHAIYQLHVMDKERHAKRLALRRELDAVEGAEQRAEARRRVLREMRQLEQGRLNRAPLRGALLRTYVAHIAARCAVEVAFMTGQYLLFGHRLSALYKCSRAPCPNVVDCFVSRPTEKSVFMVFMQTIACISLFLSLLEVLHLGYKEMKKGLLDVYPQIKDDLDDYYGSHSKRGSVVHQVCVGTSAGRTATVPTAPSGYALLLERQGNGPTCPVLSASSAFLPVQADPCARRGSVSCAGSKEPGPGSPEQRNSNSNNTSSESRESRSPSTDKQGEPDRTVRSQPRHKYLEHVSRCTYPTVPVANASSCPTLSNIARRPRRASPPWDCSTVPEGNGSDSAGSCPGSLSMKPRGSFIAARTRTLSRSDLKRPSRDRSPDSAGELSSVSRLSHDYNSRVSAGSSSISSRRAPTDLQI